MGRFDPGQALIQALEGEGQFFVVDAKLVEDGRMQVADSHRILDHVVAEIVGHAMRLFLSSKRSHPW